MPGVRGERDEVSIEAPDRLNGHTPPDPGRIRFGPGPIEDLHPDAASKVLTHLKDKYPQVFMTCLAAAYGVDLTTGKRAPKTEAGQP